MSGHVQEAQVKQARPAAPLRVAVVGCGALAQSQHLPNITASSRMMLYACCDVSQAMLETCQAKFKPQQVSTDYTQVLKDPAVDLVVLAATERLRLPVIQLAAEQGKPIYVEKPLARSLEEAYQIQRVVREAGIPFCIGHNRRSSPAMIEAHAIFRRHMANPQSMPWRWNREGAARPALPEDGAPGMSVRINDDWWSWKGWVFDKEQAPHGPMLFEMTHFTDLCNWFLDDEPEVVMALESGMLNHGVIIRYRGGAVATIGMFANGTFGYPKELYEIFGHGGAVVIDHMVEVRTAGIPGAPAHKTYPLIRDRFPHIQAQGLEGWLAKKQAACQEAAQQGDPMLQLAPDADKGHARHLERFVDEVLGQGPRVCGVDEAVLATRVALAAVQSAQQTKPVRLETI